MRTWLRLLTSLLLCFTLLFCSGAAFYPDHTGFRGYFDPEPAETKPAVSEPEAVTEAETKEKETEKEIEKESEKDTEKETEKPTEPEVIYNSLGEIVKKKINGLWYIWDDDYGFREEVRLAQERKVDKDSVKEEKAQIKMTCVYQLPEFSTGCEITASYMILKNNHFPISKVRFGNKYFEVKEKKTDFRYSFVGDPYSEYGLGCYAPAVVLALNRYFTVCESDLLAFNYTGYSFETLLNKVAEGYPVIIWGTQYMKEPFYGSYFKLGDDTVRWISQEHCMVLIGYNLEKKTAFINDPLAGPVEYDLDTVKKRYIQLGSQAIIVRDKDEYFNRRNKPSAFRYDPNIMKFE